MNINTSLGAMNKIANDFNKIPGRLNDALQNQESKESIESVFTDMMIDQNAYEANAKTIRSMQTTEQILLDELRNK